MTILQFGERLAFCYIQPKIHKFIEFIAIPDKRKFRLVLVAAAVVFVSILVTVIVVVSLNDETVDDTQMFIGRDVLDEVPLIDGLISN